MSISHMSGPLCFFLILSLPSLINRAHSIVPLLCNFGKPFLSQICNPAMEKQVCVLTITRIYSVSSSTLYNMWIVGHLVVHFMSNRPNPCPHNFFDLNSDNKRFTSIGIYNTIIIYIVTFHIKPQYGGLYR